MTQLTYCPTLLFQTFSVSAILDDLWWRQLFRASGTCAHYLIISGRDTLIRAPPIFVCLMLFLLSADYGACVQLYVQCSSEAKHCTSQERMSRGSLLVNLMNSS